MRRHRTLSVGALVLMLVLALIIAQAFVGGLAGSLSNAWSTHSQVAELSERLTNLRAVREEILISWASPIDDPVADLGKYLEDGLVDELTLTLSAPQTIATANEHSMISIRTTISGDLEPLTAWSARLATPPWRIQDITLTSPESTNLVTLHIGFVALSTAPPPNDGSQT